ncbi:uncharacterized protein G2W53_003705 [Senna tora]|uniref:Uncharacterized protein n=1 Tax=Senna tora TaxID=362788 RepID=A0A834XB52_9FABA|nr:uncharacterized protein G2W53_003705 [Senna tora]
MNKEEEPKEPKKPPGVETKLKHK